MLFGISARFFYEKYLKSYGATYAGRAVSRDLTLTCFSKTGIMLLYNVY